VTANLIIYFLIIPCSLCRRNAGPLLSWAYACNVRSSTCRTAPLQLQRLLLSLYACFIHTEFNPVITGRPVASSGSGNWEMFPSRQAPPDDGAPRRIISCSRLTVCHGQFSEGQQWAYSQNYVTGESRGDTGNPVIKGHETVGYKLSDTYTKDGMGPSLRGDKFDLL